MAIIVIPAGATTVPAVSDGDDILSKEGAQTITAGTDLSGLPTGVGNVSIYSGISTQATVPFRMDVTGVFRNQSTGGTVHVWPSGGAGTGVARAIHAGNGTTHFVTGGTVAQLDCLRGLVRIDGGVNVTSIAIDGGQVIQDHSATANSGWSVFSGTFNTERGLAGTGYIGHGATVQVKRRDTSNVKPTHTTGTLYVFGRLHWHGGDMNDVHVSGDGMLDLSGVDQDITINSLTISAKAYDRSILDSANPAVTITITSLNVVAGQSGIDKV